MVRWRKSPPLPYWVITAFALFPAHLPWASALTAHSPFVSQLVRSACNANPLWALPAQRLEWLPLCWSDPTRQSFRLLPHSKLVSPEALILYKAFLVALVLSPALRLYTCSSILLGLDSCLSFHLVLLPPLPSFCLSINITSSKNCGGNWGYFLWKRPELWRKEEREIEIFRYLRSSCGFGENMLYEAQIPHL